MGFSKQPLLGGEDLHLSPSEKEEVLHKINSQWNRLKCVMPVFLVLAACGCVGLILAAVILKNAELLIYLPGPALGALFYGLFSWWYAKLAAKHQAVAAQLFEEQYIGSWKFEPHTWRDFAKYLFQQKMKAMKTLAILSVFILAMGIIPFIVLVATEHQLSVGIIFCVTMSGPLFAFTLLTALIGGITLYPRYRSYCPTVHCCVLGRGSVYLLGTMYTLQPATACSATMIYNLTSVTLEEKMIETNMTKILRLDTKTRVKNGESSLTLEVPVPDRFVQNVSHWMYTLAEGYTSEVRNTIEGAAMKREDVPPAVATVYVRDNDITH